MKINWLQRIVLIMGAIALLLIAAASEQNEPIMSRDTIISWNSVFDWKAALTRSIIVAGAFGAIFIAVGKRKE
jgi:hypothetical protein